MKRYQPSEIESQWQQVWEQTKLYAAADNDPRAKYYYLVEFPYPSGEGLHVGHVRSYTALDIMARHKRMQGFNVLYPMGFDAFGLPTENYAIKNKVAPQDATATNIANYTRQLKALGLSFDWDRAVNTTDPDYYRWTQWIFLQMYKAGLAYQAEMPINWCPFEKTGLANEEVVNGVHERCGTPVEKKLMKQWMLKITAYADRLIDDLKTVDYLDRISSQQINWIGRSEGAEITFKLTGIAGEEADKYSVDVYTTRPDTLFGATFIVVSPELADSWIKVGWKASDEAASYINHALNESELSRQEDKVKTGVDTGIKAIHPLSGELLPVWVADYVLGGYGTGAIMAVPAHDPRDNEFAVAFGLPIRQVVMPSVVDTVNPPKEGKQNTTRTIIHGVVEHPTENKIMYLQWQDQPWRTFVTGGVEAGEDVVEAARREIAEETGFTDLEYTGTLPYIIQSQFYAAHKDVNRKVQAHVVRFKLKSLERIKVSPEEVARHEPHWIDRDKVGTLSPVSEIGYIVRWLQVGDHVYTDYGPLINSGKYDGIEGAQAKHAIIQDLESAGAGKIATKYKLRDWVFSRQHYWGEPIPMIHCAKCGVVPVPEDQLPVTLPKVDSYEPTETGESPLAAITDWVNTTCPTCSGPAKRETDTMPNWAGSSWYYLRYIDPKNDQAFADRAKLDYWTPVDLYNGGMEHTTLHLLYSRFWHKFLFDQGLVPTSEPYARRRSHGMVLGPDGQKMSKSRGNVINPDGVIERYGADAIRLYEMFMGPFDEQTAWSDERLSGVSRFLYRVWTLVDTLTVPKTQSATPDGIFATEVDRATHKALKKVSEDIHSMSFNTMVSTLMEYVNFLQKNQAKLASADNTDLADRTVRYLMLMLAPMVPHMTEEIWHETLRQEGSVHSAAWPLYDPELIKDELISVAVQVNGKLRATVILPVDATDEYLAKAAKADLNVAKYLAAGNIVKTVVVPRKLVNFVVK
jgi:leucyl-tRNA synthetase